MALSDKQLETQFDDKFNAKFREIVNDYGQELRLIAETLEKEPKLTSVLGLLIKCYESDRTVYCFGNGGSASTASHFACDLAKTASVDGKKRLRIFCLNDSMPLVTAISNDISFDAVLKEQLVNCLKPSSSAGKPGEHGDQGDLLFVFSASGNSKNIINGIKQAHSAGAKVAGVLGFGGGEAAKLCDVSIILQSKNYGPSEDFHLIFNHILTLLFREYLHSTKSR